jgi:hypothetical protein
MALAFILSALVVYLSAIAGLILYRAAHDELNAYSQQLRIILSLIFTSIHAVLLFSFFPDNPIIYILATMLIMIVSFASKIWSYLFFAYLSIIFALAYFFSAFFVIVSVLIFIFGMIGAGMNLESATIKKVFVRRAFFILLSLVLFIISLI